MTVGHQKIRANGSGRFEIELPLTGGGSWTYRRYLADVSGWGRCQVIAVHSEAAELDMACESMERSTIKTVVALPRRTAVGKNLRFLIETEVALCNCVYFYHEKLVGFFLTGYENLQCGECFVNI